MNFFRESLAKKSDTFSTSAKSFPLTPNCYQQKQIFSVGSRDPVSLNGS